MKRNPRWMVVAVVAILIAMSCLNASAGPLPPVHWLPNDPQTIGDPDGSPGGKNYQVPPGNYAVVPIAGGAWTIRLDLGYRLLSLLRHQSRWTQGELSHSHD